MAKSGSQSKRFEARLRSPECSPQSSILAVPTSAAEVHQLGTGREIVLNEKSALLGYINLAPIATTFFLSKTNA